jgi:hypothetical protein
LLPVGLVVAAAPAAEAQGTTWYAAPTAQGSGSCADANDPCTFDTALGQAASGDSIDLASGAYSDADYNDTVSLTIEAEPGATPTFEGDGSGVVLTVESGATTTVSGVTVSSEGVFGVQGVANFGSLTLDSCTIFNNVAGPGSLGGGIYDAPSGNLTVDGCTIQSNSAGEGGAIYEDNNDNASPGPSVTIENSVVSNNESVGGVTVGVVTGSGGGGVFNIFGSLAITGSLIQSNSASGAGGGIASYGVIDLDKSAVIDNSAPQGGGLSGGFGYVVDSTFFGDTATATQEDGGGGGAIQEGTVNLYVISSTIVVNSPLNIFSDSGDAPGMALWSNAPGGAINVAGSIVMYGQHGGEYPPEPTPICAGNIVDAGYNVDDDASCGFSSADGSVSGSLAIDDYVSNSFAGSPLDTTVSLLLSPAVPTAAANPALMAVPGNFSVPVQYAPNVTPCALTDQRGAPRPTSGCDMGAYEATQPTSLTLTASTPSVGPDQSVTYTAAVGPIPSGGTVSFTDGTGNPATNDCASVPVTSGVATCTVSYQSPGSYQVSASYSGTTGFAPSSTAATLSEDVNQTVLYVSPSAGSDGSCVEDDPCTLPTALAESFSGDTIELFAGTYTGDFVDNTSVTIEPVPAVGTPVLSGGGSGTVLSIEPGDDTTVIGVQITDGAGTRSSVGVAEIARTPSTSRVGSERYNPDATARGTTFAGGVYNGGTLVLEDSAVSGNSVTGFGGGIYNDVSGDLTVLRSTISGNSAEDGSGIYNADAGQVLVKDSTVASNGAVVVGGGAFNEGGAMRIEGSTFVANFTGTGQGGQGNSIYNDSSGVVTMASSIFATGHMDVIVGPQCYNNDPGSGGLLVDSGYNIDDDGSCGLTSPSVSDSQTIDGALGALASYGGPTQTVQLLASESPDPALAAIPASFVLPDGMPACSGTDQRGVARQTGCDIGAFELDVTTVILTSSAPSVGPGQSVTYTATVTPAPDGGTVAFSDRYGITTTQCPAQPIANGVATCTVDYSLPGMLAVSATYSGDTDYAAGTSQSLTEDVVTAVLYASPTNELGGLCIETDPCSLGAALEVASPGNTIELFGGTYASGNEDTTSVTIEPVPGTTPVVLVGDPDRAVYIGAGVSTTLDDVTVSGAYGKGSPNADPKPDLRGLVTGPPPPVEGDGLGGIENFGKLVLVDSTVTSDQGTDGGGIYNGSEADLTLLDSTVSGNTATDGGGVYNEGILLVKDSTIADNTAADNGGGIYNEAFAPDPATATIEGSTLSANKASGEGTDKGNAIWTSSAAATTTFATSIVATAGGPPVGGECGGSAAADAGYNVSDDNTCGFKAANRSVSGSSAIDDYLGALGSVGGPTQTIPLLPTSKPVTKASDPALASVPDNQTLPDGTFSCAGTDQRGVTRQSPCDMGAFEQLKTEITLTASPAEVAPGGKATYTATVSPLPEGGSVTFSDSTGALSKSCSSVDVSDKGVASCTVSYPALGKYEVTASYAGNDDFASSGPSAVTVTVGQGGGKTATTTSLTSSTTTPSPGTPVTLSASVSPVPDGGTISFLDEGKALPSCAALPLSNGRASCRVVLAAGPHDVVASYGGNATLAPSNSPPVAIEVAVPTVGYWLTDTTGDVFAFGSAAFLGNLSSHHGQAPVVGMAAAPGGKGYWLVDSTGGVSAFGTAQPHGSLAPGKASAPIVGIVTTPDGGGYWLAAADGAAYAFGDAKSLGSMFGRHFTGPIVGIAATPDGQGYWLTAANGGVFAFGAAAFHGSMQSIHLTRPIVGIAPSVDGHGYFLVAGDGGVFAFGDAHFHGSLGRAQLLSPIVGLAPDYATGGYWIVTGHGSVYAFDAPFLGSLGDLAPVSRVAAIDAG